MKYLVMVLALSFSQWGLADIAWQTYSPASLASAQKMGKKVVLGFHKKGCGTCHAQDKALDGAGITKAKDVVFLKVQRKNKEHTSTYEKFGFSSRQWAAMVLLDTKGQEVARIDPGVTSGDPIKQFAMKTN